MDGMEVFVVEIAAVADDHDFEFYFDTNKDYMRAMNVVTMPHLLLFDRNGKLVYTHIGYSPGDEEQLFAELLKLKSAKR